MIQHPLCIATLADTAAYLAANPPPRLLRMNAADAADAAADVAADAASEAAADAAADAADASAI